MKNLIHSKKEKPLENLVLSLHFVLIELSLLVFFVMLIVGMSSAQDAKSINSINSSMPNRISMNVTVAKQTQGATFGEKVNAGLHAAGSSVAQGTSLVGAALPGGSIISAALSKTNSEDKEWEVKNQGNGFTLPENMEPGDYMLTIIVASGNGGSEVLRTGLRLGVLSGEKEATSVISSVSSLSGSAGGGAAAASYAATGRSVSMPGKPGINAKMPDNPESLKAPVSEENVYSIYINGVEYAMVKSKTRHDTVKNSINNVR
jgi:hypothetical protein